MSYTEVTSRSWFKRVGTALVMVLVGIVLIPVCLWLLFWNEGRSVGVARALVEGADRVVAISADRVDPSMEGQLVHLSGAVKPQGVPRDALFGIEAPGAVSLVRQVEMFQWVETSESRTETKLGGSEETVTVYSYSRQWRADHIDSSDFKVPEGHENPDRKLPGERFTVPEASIGAFTVEGGLLADIGTDTGLSLTQADAQAVGQGLRGRRPVSLGDGEVYVGEDDMAPRIGDLRISFQRVDLDAASLVGTQTNGRVGPYVATNGYSFLLAQPGTVTPDAMFETAQAENVFLTWLLRVAGLVGLFIGFFLILNVLSVVVSVLPFLGSLVGFGGAVVAFLLAVVLGGVTIATAWIFYRPLLAVLLLAGVGILAFLIVRFRRTGKPAAKPAILGGS